MALARALAIVALACGIAAADPATSQALREGNTAATAGDWQKVEQLVAPLFAQTLARADLAEAHRLAGLAAFFQQRLPDAEAHFLAYMKLDLDGRLDPALYPPDVVAYFGEVRARHDAELRALRPKQRRYWLLNLIPPGGQIQNGDHVKAYVIGGLIGTMLVTNITSYLVLRSWCTHTEGTGGSGSTCDSGGNHYRAASILRPLNIASGIGLILSYAYGVYDGVQGYRRHTEATLQPFVAPSGVVGISGSF